MILFGHLPAWRDIIYLPANGFSSRPECCHQPHNSWAGRSGDLKEVQCVCMCVIQAGEQEGLFLEQLVKKFLWFNLDISEVKKCCIWREGKGT